MRGGNPSRGVLERVADGERCQSLLFLPIDVLSSHFQGSNVDALLSAHTHLLPVDVALEDAVSRALDEVLGARAEDIRSLIQANYPPCRAAIPPAESMVLWLRNNLPDSAPEILERARQCYEPLASNRL